jgi:hypothetical protein
VSLGEEMPEEKGSGDGSTKPRVLRDPPGIEEVE